MSNYRFNVEKDCVQYWTYQIIIIIIVSVRMKEYGEDETVYQVDRLLYLFLILMYALIKVRERERLVGQLEITQIIEILGIEMIKRLDKDQS